MDRGFTIVEVLLFISISGLIILMVLTGFNGSIESNRRIDTNRSFEAAIEAEYTSVRSGTVVRGMDGSGKVDPCVGGPTRIFPGQSNDCIVIGKLLRVTQGSNSKIYSYNVIANVNPSIPCLESGVRAILSCYQARVLDLGKPTLTITPEWSAQISGIDFRSKDETAYRSYSATQMAHIAILRDPASELVYIMPLVLPSYSSGQQSLFADSDAGVGNFANSKGQICLKHDGLLLPKSYLRFNGGEGVGSIEVTPGPLFTGVTAC